MGDGFAPDAFRLQGGGYYQWLPRLFAILRVLWEGYLEG